MCSQDCLRSGLCPETLTLTPPLRPRRNPNPSFATAKSNPRTTNFKSSCSRRRKRSPVGVGLCQQAQDRSQSRSMVVKFPTKNFAMGQVKILKRGETLNPWFGVPGENQTAKVRSEEDLDVIIGSTDRLGPDPETVQRQIRRSTEFEVGNEIYAGSGAFFTSPPPSSVPVPLFLGEKGLPYELSVAIS